MCSHWWWWGSWMCWSTRHKILCCDEDRNSLPSIDLHYLQIANDQWSMACHIVLFSVALSDVESSFTLCLLLISCENMHYMQKFVLLLGQSWKAFQHGQERWGTCITDTNKHCFLFLDLWNLCWYTFISHTFEILNMPVCCLSHNYLIWAI